MTERYDASEVASVAEEPIGILPVVRRVENGVTGLLVEGEDGRFHLREASRPEDAPGTTVLPQQMYVLSIHQVFHEDDGRYNKGSYANLQE